jgi:hypothetical protein
MTDTAVSAFIGYWKIIEMEVWAQKYVDLVVPGFIEFTVEDERLMGSFQFGTVVGWLDCRLRQVDGATSVEWSWDGRSDTDPASGRGWATIVDDTLVGRVFIHAADDSAFKATRRPRPPKHPPRTEERDVKSTAPHFH